MPQSGLCDGPLLTLTCGCLLCYSVKADDVLALLPPAVLAAVPVYSERDLHLRSSGTEETEGHSWELQSVLSESSLHPSWKNLWPQIEPQQSLTQTGRSRESGRLLACISVTASAGHPQSPRAVPQGQCFVVFQVISGCFDSELQYLEGCT